MNFIWSFDLNSVVKVGKSEFWVDDHFPDDPLMPCIVQLKLVTDFILANWSEYTRVESMSRVRFKKIIRPGDMLSISVEPGKSRGLFSFSLGCGNEEVCSGNVYCS